MLKPKIESILNSQIGKELYSSLLYLSMASWAEHTGYAGIAKWLYAQAEEEKLHMLKFVNYINDRGGHAIIPAVEQPPVKHGTVKEMFESVLEHENKVTEWINDIVAATIEQKDFTTQNWVQWFVTEQIEEEASVKEILDKLHMLNGENMYMFDRDILSMRTQSATPAK
ncbi:MAG: ferritin [Bacteroidota bacterium]|nr:MAG: ferritin [Bacteroidota bacterium]